MTHPRPSRGRPTSVWVTQALLVVCIVSTILAIAAAIAACFFTETSQCSSPSGQLQLLLVLGLGMMMVTAFRGLQHRKAYGRWLGAIFLVLLMLGAIAANRSLQLLYGATVGGDMALKPPYGEWRREGLLYETYYGYSSYGQLLWQSLLNLGFCLIPGWIATRLVWSRAVHQFFRTK